MKKLDKTKSYNCENLTKPQFKQLKKYFISIGDDWSKVSYKDFKYDEASTIYYMDDENGWMRTSRYKGQVNIEDMFKNAIISRFEYITNEGRQIVEYGEFEFQLQDDNRTLKVFKK